MNSLLLQSRLIAPVLLQQMAHKQAAILRLHHNPNPSPNHNTTNTNHNIRTLRNPHHNIRTLPNPRPSISIRNIRNKGTSHLRGITKRLLKQSRNKEKKKNPKVLVPLCYYF